MNIIIVQNAYLHEVCQLVKKKLKKNKISTFYEQKQCRVMCNNVQLGTTGMKIHVLVSRTVDGVSFQSGGYYITVQYYERFPPSSTCIFKLSSRKYTVDDEGVIARNVRVVATGRRSRGRTERTIITLASDQCRELIDIPSLSDL